MRGRPRSVRVPVVKCSTLAPRARRSCGGERDIPEGRLAGGVGGGKAAGCTGRAGSPREEAGWGSGAGGGEGAGARQESSRK